VNTFWVKIASVLYFLFIYSFCKYLFCTHAWPLSSFKRPSITEHICWFPAERECSWTSRVLDSSWNVQADSGPQEGGEDCMQDLQKTSETRRFGRGELRCKDESPRWNETQEQASHAEDVWESSEGRELDAQFGFLAQILQSLHGFGRLACQVSYRE